MPTLCHRNNVIIGVFSYGKDAEYSPKDEDDNKEVENADRRKNQLSELPGPRGLPRIARKTRLVREREKRVPTTVLVSNRKVK